MFETVVIATDGSGSACRAVEAALDLAARFGATVHALYVVDEGEIDASPAEVREQLERALATIGGEALTFAREAAEVDSEREIVTVVREGDPVTEICAYADEQNADLVATGTRGRHGEHGFVLGSVAEGVVKRCDAAVMTVRQLESEI
ncbi:MAG: universal stress protein [Haloarculaceae archaeon]